MTGRGELRGVGELVGGRPSINCMRALVGFNKNEFLTKVTLLFVKLGLIV